MPDVYSTWSDMRKVRDELALHLHLASMEARSRWAALQPRLARFEAAVIKAGEELGRGFEREAAALSSALRALRDELLPHRALAEVAPR